MELKENIAKSPVIFGEFKIPISISSRTSREKINNQKV